MDSDKTKSYFDWEDNDSHGHNAPWYWRLLAFSSSWLILAGFLALPSLYDTEPALRLSRTTVSVPTIAALITGFSLTILLSFAIRSPTFRLNHVYIPCLSSTSLGLVVLLLSFAVSSRYAWSISAILGVVAASASGVIYALLALRSQRQIASTRQTISTSRPEVETSLLKASNGRSRSHSMLSGIAASPGESPWNMQDMAQNNSANSGSGAPGDNGAPTNSYFTEISSPRPSFHSRSQSAYDNDRPHSRSAALRPDSSSTSRPRTVSQPYAHVLSAASPGEVPVQTVPANIVNPEEEMTRQQMLRLLLTQTSEQVRQNPETQTFKIELPREMRQALRSNTFDIANAGMGTTVTNTSFAESASGRHGPMAPQQAYTHERSSSRSRQRQKTSSRGSETGPIDSVYAWRRNDNGFPRDVKDRALHGIVPPPKPSTSVQQTPASAYGPGATAGAVGWKTRDERRREIERLP